MKSNLVENEKTQKWRILRAMFFRKKLDKLSVNLSGSKILTVFELYVVEALKECFKQLRYEKPVLYLQEKYYKIEGIMTRSKMNRLLQPSFCLIDLKKKSMRNVLRIVYNWLERMSSIPDKVKMMSFFWSETVYFLAGFFRGYRYQNLL